MTQKLNLDSTNKSYVAINKTVKILLAGNVGEKEKRQIYQETLRTLYESGYIKTKSQRIVERGIKKIRQRKSKS